MTARSRANRPQLDVSTVAHRLSGWSNGDGPLYLQLAAAVASLIDEGVLGDGDRLPAERALADELAVSRGTVVAAFSTLSDQQRVERRQGSGTIVRASSSSYRGDSTSPRADALFQPTRDSIDLLLAMPEITPLVLELVRGVAFDPGSGLLDVFDPAGIVPLRVAIADRITRDGLPTSAEQIMVTNGAQQSLALLATLMLQPGDVVLTEAATWPGLADLVRDRGARVHGIAMDHDGVLVDDLRAAVDRLRPALIGFNPHHHNPTGSRLAPHRAPLVAEIAADYGVPLLEDRVVASLAFDGQVAPPLASHRPDGTHFVVDSINKVAWPGLRIGWVRADAQVIDRLRAAKASMDLFAPMPSQLMALAMLEHFDEVCRDRVAQLDHRAQVLSEALSEMLPEWHRHPVRGGLVAWVGLPRGTASEFARFAAKFGVDVAGSREFSSSTIIDDHLRLPFSRPTDDLVEAVRRLAVAWSAYEPDLTGAHSESLATASLV